MISLDALVLDASRSLNGREDDARLNSALAGAAFRIGFRITPEEAMAGLENLKKACRRKIKIKEEPMFDYDRFQDHAERNPEEGRVRNQTLDACSECNGTGYVPGTETEHTYGERCPQGCAEDMQKIRDQGQG